MGGKLAPLPPTQRAKPAYSNGMEKWKQRARCVDAAPLASSLWWLMVVFFPTFSVAICWWRLHDASSMRGFETKCHADDAWCVDVVSFLLLCQLPFFLFFCLHCVGIFWGCLLNVRIFPRGTKSNACFYAEPTCIRYSLAVFQYALDKARATMSTSATLPYARSEGTTCAHHTAAHAGPAPQPCIDAFVVSDSYWVPDVEQMDSARRHKPWRSDLHYFTCVSVSLAATVKMFIHGTRGCPDMSQGRFNWFEVMGLLIGHFRDRELVLTDSFSLPVAASEVECSMTEASQIYMANYLEYHRRLGKAEPGCVGWYHTHPGYSCFLSGIDVTTQQGSQRMQDPWVALVIDPVETLRTGQFSMKAFRTYPEGYAAPESAEAAPGADRNEVRDSPPVSPFPIGGSVSSTSFGLPPTNRMKDFGMHANRYYELPVKVVQSNRDAPLWAQLRQKFWPLSLSLTFPFAASTRTCQCCSHDLTCLTAALAALTADKRSSGKISVVPGLLGAGQRSLGSEVVQRPPLYRLGGSASVEGRLESTRGTSSESKKNREKMAMLERRLLTLAESVLQARLESFSLMNTQQPVRSELVQALCVVSAAQRAAIQENEQ